MSEFFAMGGYAAFVWPCFIVVAVVMIGLTLWTQGSLRASRATLARLEAETKDTTDEA